MSIRSCAVHVIIFSNSSIIPTSFKFTELHALTLAIRSYALLLKLIHCVTIFCLLFLPQDVFAIQEGVKQLFKERRVFLFEHALIISKKRRDSSDRDTCAIKEELLVGYHGNRNHLTSTTASCMLM